MSKLNVWHFASLTNARHRSRVPQTSFAVTVKTYTRAFWQPPRLTLAYVIISTLLLGCDSVFSTASASSVPNFKGLSRLQRSSHIHHRPPRRLTFTRGDAVFFPRIPGLRDITIYGIHRGTYTNGSAPPTKDRLYNSKI